MHNALSYLKEKNVKYIDSTVHRLRLAIAKRSTLEEVKKVLADDLTGDCYKVFYHNHDNATSSMGDDIQSPAGNSCLLFAIASQAYDIANILIEDAQKKLSIHEYKEFISYQYHNPLYPEKDSETKDYYKNTALTLSAKYGQYKLLTKLLDADADPNLGDEYNITPLSILCFQLGLVTEDKNSQILENINLLKSKGANFSETDQTGLKPLDYLLHDLDGREIRGVQINFDWLIKMLITPSEVAADPISLLEMIQNPDSIKNMMLELGYPYCGSEKELYTIITDSITKNHYKQEHISIAHLLYKGYAYVINNDYTTDAKIYNSMHWGEKIVQEKLQNYFVGHEYPNLYYGFKDKSYKAKSYKQDFFNTENGKNLADKIYNIFDSNLENVISGEEVLELVSIIGNESIASD